MSEQKKMSEQRKDAAIKGSEIKSNEIKGNEAEEFIKRIVLKVLLSTVVLVVGVGIAVYYTSGAV
jgi:hypothetical protein